MNAIETVINRVSGMLTAELSGNDVQKVIRAMSVVLMDYDVTAAERSLTTYEGYIPESVKIYLVSRKIEGVKDGTLQNYRRQLEEFFRMIPKPLDEITANDVRYYLYKIQDERQLCNASLDKRRITISSYFTWCVENDYLTKSPAHSIKPIKNTSEGRKPLTELELERMRASCKSLRDKAIIDFFCSSACRVSEVSALNRDQLDFLHGQIKVHGKGDKDREAFIRDRAKVSIQAYLDSRTDSNEALFVSVKGNRLNRYDLRTIVSKIAKDAGITRPVYPHLLRHTVATLAVNRGMPITSVQKMLGHSNLETTMIYAKISEESVKADHTKYVV